MNAKSLRWDNSLLGERYRVLHELGEGAMGKVYLAYDERLKIQVVVKAPLPSVLEQPENAARFQREMRAMTALAHHHIAKILDVGEHEGLPFVVMQYLGGGDLYQRIVRDGTFFPQTLAELNDWLGPIAEALDYIHSKNYVHRDVKPPNIFFDGEGHALLGDLGIARAVEGAVSDGEILTRRGIVIGTAAYMSPEAVRGEADAPSDQYALAATVYESLTGRVPYEGNSVVEIADAQANKPIARPDNLNPDVGAAVAEVILKALSLDKNERFADCSSFASALKQAATQAEETAVAADTRSTKRRETKPDGPADAQSWLGRDVGDGRYHVESRLGAGGMGEVYKAFDAKLQTHVVLKIPRATLLADHEFSQRFQREMRLLVRLQHPHVAAVIDVDEHLGLPFVVMRYLGGGDLYRKYRDGGDAPPHPSTLNDWLPEIIKALEFIHSQDVVHRDVKPGNILLDESGNAYLTDFGIARVVEEGGTQRGLTIEGTSIGTAPYMSPELLRGVADRSCDLFALAVTVYEILTRKLPFEGTEVGAVAVSQMNQSVTPIHELNPAASLELSEAVSKALAFEPDKRFATPSDFGAAVTAALSAPPAPPSSPPEQPGRPEQPRRPEQAVAQFRHSRTVNKPDQLKKSKPSVTPTCPKCSTPLNVTAEHVGKMLRCRRCKTRLSVGPDPADLRIAESPAASDTRPADAPSKTKRTPVALLAGALGGLAVGIVVIVMLSSVSSGSTPSFDDLAQAETLVTALKSELGNLQTADGDRIAESVIKQMNYASIEEFRAELASAARRQAADANPDVRERLEQAESLLASSAGRIDSLIKENALDPSLATSSAEPAQSILEANHRRQRLQATVENLSTQYARSGNPNAEQSQAARAEEQVLSDLKRSRSGLSESTRSRATAYLRSENSALKKLAGLALAKAGDPAGINVAREELNTGGIDFSTWVDALLLSRNAQAVRVVQDALVKNLAKLDQVDQQLLLPVIEQDPSGWDEVVCRLLRGRQSDANFGRLLVILCKLKPACGVDALSAAIQKATSARRSAIIQEALRNRWIAPLKEVAPSNTNLEIDLAGVQIDALEQGLDVSPEFAALLVGNALKNSNRMQVDWAIDVLVRQSQKIDLDALETMLLGQTPEKADRSITVLLTSKDASAIKRLVASLLARFPNVPLKDLDLAKVPQGLFDDEELRQATFEMLWKQTDGQRKVLTYALGEDVVQKLRGMSTFPTRVEQYFEGTRALLSSAVDNDWALLADDPAVVRLKRDLIGQGRLKEFEVSIKQTRAALDAAKADVDLTELAKSLQLVESALESCKKLDAELTTVIGGKPVGGVYKLSRGMAKSLFEQLEAFPKADAVAAQLKRTPGGLYVDLSGN